MVNGEKGKSFRPDLELVHSKKKIKFFLGMSIFDERLLGRQRFKGLMMKWSIKSDLYFTDGS